ncbi:FAD-dependent pyridine nucleotide-disulfide oxidoreductase [Burkholderia humptydooensis MSMB43]|uniref:FAD-dependent pyridine nucleotide-disulfide oxidoreductase n=1 Tax=Burkholderia humptydooensis MSMB43 TaxID=441157 RepID=A0ABN0G3C4_9BURK|nr:FAD-dependent pyridine nucleotide-disulfide oxidoreductase [Burkholderia humptydooensis MSMB43]
MARPDRADRRGTASPYERPPLSKAVLTGERGAGQCGLRPLAAWRDDRIGHVVATVARIDPSAPRSTSISM